MDDSFEDDDQCQQCDSHSFHIEAGRTICARGHDQGRAPVVGDDEAAYGTQGKLVRREKEKRVKALKVFHGKKAYKLFLQAYQFILWKQCHMLVHEKTLPAELWTVVRDLWTLRLSRQLERLEKSSREIEASRDQSSSAQETEGGSDFEQLNPDGKMLLGNASHAPTLIQTIALCFLGITLLRLPVSLATLFRWTREDDIVYLRAIRHVPDDLKDKLPGTYHEALDTQFLLTQDRLQDTVFQLQRLYHRSFSMTFPPTNWRPLLLEHIKNLGLPLEAFTAVQNLNHIVGYDFKPDLSRPRRRTMSLPDAQLMSLIIITVKLIYPFDSASLTRHPRSINEPASQCIDWKAWLEAQTLFDSHGQERRLPRGKEAAVRDVDTLTMSEQQLDDYMDWYQRTWTRSTSASESIARNVLDQFPLKSLPAQDDRVLSEATREARVLEKLRAMHSSLEFIAPISDDDEDSRKAEVLRPGAHYAIFRSARELDSYPAARLFHETAAALACLSLETMLRAVTQTERRITIWRRATRRAELFGGDIDIEAEGGVGMTNRATALSEFEITPGLAMDRTSEEEQGPDEREDEEAVSDVEMSE